MKNAIIIIWYILLFAKTYPQAVRIIPEKPIPNDTITLQYNCTDTGVIFTIKDEVYARIVAYMQDGTFERHTIPLRPRDNILAGGFIVPTHAASMRIQFYTLNRDDDNAEMKLKIYTRTKNIPVEGAYMEDFFDDNPQRPFEMEISHYPDNYFAWAKYFNVVSMIQPAAEKVIIVPWLRKADSIYHTGKITPGLLSALCVGYAKTGELVKAKLYLDELFKGFPLAGVTAFTFSIYNYEYYKSSGKDIENDILDSIKYIFMRYPAAALADDANIFYYLFKDKRFR